MSVGSTSDAEPMGVAEIEAVYRVRDDAERNRLITETYSDLSRRMRLLIGPHAELVHLLDVVVAHGRILHSGRHRPAARLPPEPAARSGSGASCAPRSGC